MYWEYKAGSICDEITTVWRSPQELRIVSTEGNPNKKETSAPSCLHNPFILCGVESEDQHTGLWFKTLKFQLQLRQGWSSCESYFPQQSNYYVCFFFLKVCVASRPPGSRSLSLSCLHSVSCCTEWYCVVACEWCRRERWSIGGVKSNSKLPQSLIEYEWCTVKDCYAMYGVFWCSWDRLWLHRNLNQDKNVHKMNNFCGFVSVWTTFIKLTSAYTKTINQRFHGLNF